MQLIESFIITDSPMN